MSLGKRPVQASGMGAVGIGGDSHGPITVTVNEPLHLPARSGYLAQVRRLAPDELLGREAELAELAEFCLAPDPAPSYVWWRAPAWAGKSALMSWFVLHPPDGVRVVSFFITARFAAQNDRVAFADVLIEQLAHLLGEPMPAHLTDATRDAALITMLGEAADVCRRHDERLVLVVDGLDEDRGVTAGPDAYSIAALLPRNPLHGLRVIVAGRPNPPVPTDVPGRHPLRDPAVVRALAPSHHAEVVQADGQRELKRLLQGSETERDLLGLLTAAAGGLSGADLSELTDLPEWEVEENLHAVAGRTFLSRVGRWREKSIVYVLGHEELQQEAVRYLGTVGLARYRERLHVWADRYRERAWPEETPEFLLRGYYRLLQSTRDLRRMMQCTTDAHRHRRLLEVTGGDAVALTEIVTLQEVIAGQPKPDPVMLARLAAQHSMLTGRNSNIPADLPSIWVNLGRVARAEALARSISVPKRQAEALQLIAVTLAAVGKNAEATSFVGSLPDVAARRSALAGMAQGSVAAGNVEDAMVAVDLIDDPPKRDAALAQVARSVAASGDVDQALVIAALVAAPYRRDHAHAELARVVAMSGDIPRAEAIARSVEDPHRRRYALDGVARVSARPRIADLAAAESEALAVPNPEWRDFALTNLIEAAAAAGDVARAEAAASALTDPVRRDVVLPSLATAAANDGRYHLALRIAGSIGNPLARNEALSKAARAAAARGNLDQSDGLLRHLDDPKVLIAALTSVGRESLSVDPIHAAAAAERAERIARSTADRSRQLSEISLLAPAAAMVRDTSRAALLLARAEALATQSPPRSMIQLALVAAVCGDVERALRHIGQVMTETRALSEFRESAYSPLALAMISAGEPDRALELLGSIGELAVQERSVRRIATALAATGNRRLAVRVAETVTSRVVRHSVVDELAEPGPRSSVASILLRYQIFVSTGEDSLHYRPTRPPAEPVRLIDALAKGDWQSCLEALAAFSPAAVAALIDEYLSLID